MTDHNEAMRLADFCDGNVLYHPAAALIRKQAERIAELEAENGKFRDGLAKGLSEKTMLTELAMRNGGLYAGIEGGAAAVLASAFAEQFTSSGGINYVEVSFTHPKTGPLIVTLQRTQGKTPHQLRDEAEAERDTLRAELETERMRLVACGVVAMANTAESAAKARDMHPDYLCASVRDVAAAVDREMDLRAEVERLRVDAERYQWLRDPDNVAGYSIFNRYECMLSAEVLDTAIDTARKEAT